jgi:hypothetical protein
MTPLAQHASLLQAHTPTAPIILDSGLTFLCCWQRSGSEKMPLYSQREDFWGNLSGLMSAGPGHCGLGACRLKIEKIATQP